MALTASGCEPRAHWVLPAETGQRAPPQHRFRESRMRSVDQRPWRHCPRRSRCCWLGDKGTGLRTQGCGHLPLRHRVLLGRKVVAVNAEGSPKVYAALPVSRSDPIFPRCGFLSCDTQSGSIVRFLVALWNDHGRLRAESAWGPGAREVENEGTDAFIITEGTDHSPQGTQGSAPARAETTAQRR